MGEHEDKTKRDQQDSYELGPVESVNDLQPESNAGPTRKAKASERIIQPTSSGYFELEAGSGGGMGAPLHVGAEIKKDGGPAIDEYETGYNAYAQPLRSTLRAMGRVKDVSLTGAPLTPAELMRRPDLAARFGRLNPETTNAQQDAAFDQWSAQQTKMKNDIQRYGAGQHELAGVIANYRRVQAKLRQREAEAERATKTSELREIREAAETLARIVEVSTEAWNAVGEIDEQLEKQIALDENAEGMETGEGLPSDASAPTGASQSTKSKAQRVAGAGQSAASGAKGAGSLVAHTKAQLDKVGHVSLKLDDVFALLVNDKFTNLQQDIVLLDGQIAGLQMTQEAQDLKSANEQLRGFSIELVVRQHDVRGDRAAARKGARTAAKGIGGGNADVTAMYAAEAYQELAGFGELAAMQRKSMVDPSWGQVHGYVYSYDPHRFAAIGALDDARQLAANLQDVQDQRRYFDKHVPEWQQVAKQWNEFIGAKTGSDLIAGDNEADRKSEAP